MRNINRFATGLVLVAFLACAANAQDPADVGMSTEHLERIDDLLEEYIDTGKLAMASAVVSRRGQIVYRKVVGMQDIETATPLSDSTLFRIYSMTKPITSVATLMLYEEGKFLLGDPVSRFIPAFANLKVYDADVPGKRAVLARPVTIRDLLSHQAGLTYGLFGDSPVDSLYLAARLFQSPDLKDFVNRISQLPLVNQPGERWVYSVATDVLGLLIETVSGQTLDEFFRERIFEPLQMHDTRFSIEPDKMHRFSTYYQHDRNGQLIPFDRGASSSFAAPVTFFSGGGGLVSTVSDYMRFACMLLNSGTLDGTSILSRKTVELMTTNHLKNDFMPGGGFGLGVRVQTNTGPAEALESPGMYGWAGIANTFFFVDPQESLIGMVWTQHYQTGIHPIGSRFQTAVYEAVRE